jgi:hypothetical protein
MTLQTPWAVILCRFKDSDEPPLPRERYDELFTTAGSGKLNMTDFFRDMSHGKLDLSGSQVFGWFTLEQKRSDYVGSGTNGKGRQDLIAWARKAATDNGVDLSKFFSVVVSAHPPADVFGGPNGAVVDDWRGPPLGATSLSPSIVGQEMGHVYGLQHSSADGSGAAYMDQWDVMSTASAYMRANPLLKDALFQIGPGLNAANMDYCGWLDQSRVWTIGDYEQTATVQLRPLHRRDLPGYLVARVAQYYIEFRVPEIWDAGIPQAAVLVHDLFNGVSYIYSGASGNQALVEGDSFQRGDPSDPLGALVRIEVTDIDAAGRTATLEVVRRPNRHRFAGPATILVGGDTDGGGLIMVGGQLVRLKPRSPLLPILRDLAAAAEVESDGTARVAATVRRDALLEVSAAAGAEVQRMLADHEPARPTTAADEEHVNGAGPPERAAERLRTQIADLVAPSLIPE